MVLFSLTISNKWFMSKKCVQRLKYTHRYSSTSSSPSHSSWACVPRPSRWTACHILCWATISSGAVERMRWKPFCATWNCFTWHTMNPKHITSQEVTWTTSGSYRFHLISWHLPSKSKPLRASRADAKHVKHRLLNANAKPLQLQESGLRTHKTTAFDFFPCI